MALICINNTIVAPFSLLAGLAIIFLASVALAAEIPELALLFALFVYYLVSQNHCKVKWFGSAYQRIVDSAAGFPLPRCLTLLFVGIPLAAAAINGIPEVGGALSGTIAYCLLHFVGKRRARSPKAAQFKCTVPPAPAAKTQVTAHRQAALAATAPIEQRKRQTAGESRREASAVQAQVARPDVTGLDAEVQEIVRSGLPTAADDLVVRQIINHVRQSIVSVVPEAVITGSAAGNITHLGAQDLKPEVEIVVMASPEILTERLKAFYLRAITNGQRSQKSMSTLNPDMLQKTATRVLSERLTRLRFWRSQFTGLEPKVVLLAPAELGFCRYPIRVNFSVNNPYPQRLSMVLAKGSTRCKELIVLVTHWANARGITNASKGHLRSYAYSLLVVYFLREKSESGLIEKSTVELFGDLVRFYGDWFDTSHSDVLAVRFGVGEDQPLSAESKLFSIPVIEDPLAPGHNLASTMTAEGVVRFKEELARASRIVDANPTSLGKLLERWSPQINVVE